MYSVIQDRSGRMVLESVDFEPLDLVVRARYAGLQRARKSIVLTFVIRRFAPCCAGFQSGCTSFTKPAGNAVKM